MKRIILFALILALALPAVAQPPDRELHVQVTEPQGAGDVLIRGRVDNAFWAALVPVAAARWGYEAMIQGPMIAGPDIPGPDVEYVCKQADVTQENFGCTEVGQLVMVAGPDIPGPDIQGPDVPNPDSVGEFVALRVFEIGFGQAAKLEALGVAQAAVVADEANRGKWKVVKE